jgi:hypothetical protein
MKRLQQQIFSGITTMDFVSTIERWWMITYCLSCWCGGCGVELIVQNDDMETGREEIIANDSWKIYAVSYIYIYRNLLK